MQVLKGIAVSPGYAVSPAFVLDVEEFRICRKQVSKNKTAKEIRALENAFITAQKEYTSHLDKLSRKLDKTVLKIIESHSFMLEDETLKKDLVDAVKKNLYSAEYAVSSVIRKKIKALSAWGANSFTERIIEDFTDIERSLLKVLLKESREDVTSLKSDAIIVAKELTPAQTVSLDKEKVKGILTDKGGKTSHSAIIASSLGIPAIVGLEHITSEVSGGDILILDGQAGTVIINPDEDTIKRYKAMQLTYISIEQQLSEKLKKLPAVTKDGTRIALLGNIELPDEVETVVHNGGDGVGLYRTEFLYLNSKKQPTEKDHIEAYKKTLNILGDKKLVIRTLDIGADKMPVKGIGEQQNPIMGVRSIRLSLEQMDVFTTQLRALLQVSNFGNVSIMFPMISTVEELVRIKEVLDTVKSQLSDSGWQSHGKIKTGIMIEVPAAALIIDQLCNHVDFFSIGTNDLIAFLMAVDRTNEKVSSLYQPSHPAVLRILKQIIGTAVERKKEISICGEMSSDPCFTMLLLGLGLRTLSVVPPAIPDIKRIIRSITIEEAKEAADEALKLRDHEEIYDFLKSKTPT